MRTTLLLFVLALVACVACTVVACRGGGDGADPPTALPPRTPPGTAAPPSFGPTPPSDSPEGCPSSRLSEQSTTSGLDAGLVSARLTGVYRICGGAAVGLELRVDEETGRLAWFDLDARFVRVTGLSHSGWLEVDECTAEKCQAKWHVDDPTAGHGLPRELRMWSSPTAFELYDPSAFEGGSQEWVRVAD